MELSDTIVEINVLEKQNVRYSVYLIIIVQYRSSSEYHSSRFRLGYEMPDY